MDRVKLEDLSPEHCRNCNLTVTRANDLLEHFGFFRACTSGFRTMADQMRINPESPKSNHLKAAAIDLEDKDGALNRFCKANPKLLEEIGFWCEERRGNWQHLQIVPFGSYKPGLTRWFIP